MIRFRKSTWPLGPTARWGLSLSPTLADLGTQPPPAGLSLRSLGLPPPGSSPGSLAGRLPDPQTSDLDTGTWRQAKPCGDGGR